MDRDCKNCIHNIGGGGCKKWDCEMETLADHDKKIRNDAIDKIISYLNDCRLIEDSKGCYECLSELMEKIEQLKGAEE